MKTAPTMTRDIDIKNATDEDLIGWYNENSGKKAVKRIAKSRAEAESLAAELHQAFTDLAAGNPKKILGVTVVDDTKKGKGKKAEKAPVKGKAAAKSTPAKKEKATEESTGTRGRASAHTGKKIAILTEKKVNPRREGSIGHASFEILRTHGKPMVYEDYIAAGGRATDLNWDLGKGFVEVK